MYRTLLKPLALCLLCLMYWHASCQDSPPNTPNVQGLEKQVQQAKAQLTTLEQRIQRIEQGGQEETEWEMVDEQGGSSTTVTSQVNALKQQVEALQKQLKDLTPNSGDGDRETQAQQLTDIKQQVATLEQKVGDLEQRMGMPVGSIVEEPGGDSQSLQAQRALAKEVALSSVIIAFIAKGKENDLVKEFANQHSDVTRSGNNNQVATSIVRKVLALYSISNEQEGTYNPSSINQNLDAVSSALESISRSMHTRLENIRTALTNHQSSENLPKITSILPGINTILDSTATSKELLKGHLTPIIENWRKKATELTTTE